MIGMNAKTGAAISDELTHISQSCTDIIMTPIGSRVMRRDYGSFVPSLIDQPLIGATILMLYAAATTALMRWETRINISRLTFEAVGMDGNAVLGIEGALRQSDQPFSLMVPLRAAT